jgi:signal transduction histidine kinase
MKVWPKPLSPALTTGAVALAGALILITVTIFIVLYQERSYQAQKLQEVMAQSDVLAASVTAALIFDDAQAAQEYVSALRANPELDVVAIYNAKGRLVASIDRGQPDAVPNHVRIRTPYYAGDQIFMANPIRQNGAMVGTIYLRVTIDSPLQRFIRYSGIILLVTMAVLMLSILGVMQQALRRANLSLQAEMAERAQVEEALRQSHKMEALGQLAGGVAHDFNNLLAIIKSSLQLMQRRLGPVKTDVQRFMDAAMDGVDRASSVTQRVLAFSRRQTLTQRLTNLSELVGNTLDLIRQTVGGTVQIEPHLKADWLTLCDTNQMENVILNLAINARDAMPEGGKLFIETANVSAQASREGVPPGEYVQLNIRDTGTGMSDETRRRAFDPFFTTKPQGKGTGLGLSMTLGFVNQSNGYLQIDSQLGKGTIVMVLMPRAIGGQHRQASNEIE